MSYWKWLGKTIKAMAKAATSRGRMKAVAMDPWTEYFIGFGGVYLFSVFGLFLGINESSFYYLLLLGIIPSVAVMFHARYRREMKEKDK